MQKLILVFISIVSCLTCSAQISSDVFQRHGVSGTIVLYDYEHRQWLYSDSADAQRVMQPASTFKIINLLIGLQTKAIRDEHTVIKWPGKTDTTLYGYRPDIYKDISIKEAFEVSAGWAFVEMAKRISRKKYLNLLRRSAYGNLDLSEPGDDFWNFGAMKISPQNQVEFLIKLYENKTVFSRRNTDILKRVMITSQTPDCIVRSKTGWTRTEGKHIGWWTGYVEYKGKVYFFCTRITLPLGEDNSAFGKARKQITAAVLRERFGVEM